MKDLLRKEHYCNKIHTLLMKNSAYAPSIDNPSKYTTPTTIFTRRFWSSLSMFFKKSQPPINKAVHAIILIIIMITTVLMIMIIKAVIKKDQRLYF